MSKVWDKPITADTDWGGDASTDNLPVSGRQVQAWIKGNIKNDDAISLLIAKWLNEHTTNSITFWKGLPIDSGSLKWVDEHLTVIGGTGGSETPQDLPFIYDPVKKAWEVKGDVVVTGAITMFGSLSGFQPSTVTEAVEVDGETIVKTKNSQGQWQLTAIGRGGGTGGGISAAEVNILIENALKPYIKIETADDKYALISTVSGINSRLSAVETFFATEDSDTLINKWSEIVAFLNATEGDTLDNILATKANQSALDAAVASLTTEIGKKWTQNDAKISNWDSAYGWGNHANAGYAAKTYVDAELAKYVKLATAQKIDAQHNFVNGLQIGGLPITKSASSANTIYLDANLVVSGAITMFGKNSTTFETIWKDIPFDDTMEWTGSVWRVKDGGSGSLDTNAVNVLISEYLTQNSYATISDISSALVGYATQGWVGGNYLSQGGGTIEGDYGALDIKRNSNSSSLIKYSNTNGVLGYLGFLGANTPYFWDNSLTPIGLIHERNVKDFVQEYALPITGGTVNGNLAIGGNISVSCPYINADPQLGSLDSVGASSITASHGYGLYCWIRNTGRAHIQVGDDSRMGTSLAYDMVLQPLGGNITIGGTEAIEKLTVHGNLLTTGVVTMFSQLSMKNVIDYDGLSLEQLAQIKPARFTWKDGRDTLVHAGGIADEVMQVLPEVVYRTKDDNLTMDYGSAGFFMAASLIKPVIDHEQRLQSAEKEIKDLREENKRLREQLRIA